MTRRRVLACAKHFAGYSETQGGRDASEADISPRKLRSWFLPPFERVARAGCRTFMLGYQSMDGVPITANRWLLNDVLKGEWGFTGMLVTDWDNVGRMVWEQKVCADYVEASAVAVRAGNDLVMTTPQFFDGAQEAVARGLLAESDIDAAVRRILRLKFELGLFEDPRPPADPARRAEVIGSAEHAALNLEVARRSLVLLRNDGTLPLEGGLTAGADGRAVGTAAARTIAVIGPNADDPVASSATGPAPPARSTGCPTGTRGRWCRPCSTAFRAVAPEDWTVTYARGADIEVLVPDPAGSAWHDGGPRAPVFSPAPVDEAMLAEAVAAAEAADCVVVVVGDTIALTGETRSTATLELQGGQVALLDALAATGTPMVVVLVTRSRRCSRRRSWGRPRSSRRSTRACAAGRRSPSWSSGLIEPTGRLPLSVPRHVGQQPVYYNQIRGQHGERYADLTQEPLFAFGEGLSYTTVEYADLVVAEPVVPADGLIRARVTLTNTGTRPALETVQAYISDLVTSATWAEMELKAWRQVQVPPGRGGARRGRGAGRGVLVGDRRRPPGRGAR